MIDSVQFTSQLIPYSRKLFAVAFRITGNSEEAEDVVQDVYLKLWQMRDSLPDAEVVEALMLRMVKNRSIDCLRLRHSGSPLDGGSFSGFDDADISAQNRMEDGDTLVHLSRLMEALPEIQREMLRLRMSDGLSAKQLADAFGLTEGNVRVILARARKRLRELAIKNQIL